MRCIVGTQIVESGTVTVLDRPAGEASLRRRVGYVTQAPSVYLDLTVAENVAHFAALYGKSGSVVRDTIAAVGLGSHTKQHAGNLSGGQLGRVSLACALVGEPELLVLDEPTVGSIPFCAWNCGNTSTPWPTGGRHAGDLEPRHGRGGPLRTSAADARGPGARAAHSRRAARTDRRTPARGRISQVDPGRNGRRVVNATIYAATTTRILRQLRSDHRTVAMIVLVPSLLMILLFFIYRNVPAPPVGPSLFDRIAITMLGILPFVVMFLVTSIAMQRERSSGTLERLLTTPLTKFDLLAGYGSAFSLAAACRPVWRVSCPSGCWVWPPWETSGGSFSSRCSTPCSESPWACCAARSPAPSSRPCSSCR